MPVAPRCPAAAPGFPTCAASAKASAGARHPGPTFPPPPAPTTRARRGDLPQTPVIAEPPDESVWHQHFHPSPSLAKAAQGAQAVTDQVFAYWPGLPCLPSPSPAPPGCLGHRSQVSPLTGTFSTDVQNSGTLLFQSARGACWPCYQLWAFRGGDRPPRVRTFHALSLPRDLEKLLRTGQENNAGFCYFSNPYSSFPSECSWTDVP